MCHSAVEARYRVGVRPSGVVQVREGERRQEMSEEKTWARFFQDHKDDPGIWGEPEEDAPRASKGALSATISVRFSPEEAAAIRDLAQDLNLSYSEIVRRAVRKFVHFRLAPGGTTQDEPEEGRDLSLSNAATSTGSLASGHR
jgi:hypothetical protein